VIYCVVPPELKDELYEKLVSYYESNPDVTVIIDRRGGPDRRGRNRYEGEERRAVRDRRRSRIAGTFPKIEAPDDGA
jgi:hypothetical protein